MNESRPVSCYLRPSVRTGPHVMSCAKMNRCWINGISWCSLSPRLSNTSGGARLLVAPAANVPVKESPCCWRPYTVPPLPQLWLDIEPPWLSVIFMVYEYSLRSCYMKYPTSTVKKTLFCDYYFTNTFNQRSGNRITRIRAAPVFRLLGGRFWIFLPQNFLGRCVAPMGWNWA